MHPKTTQIPVVFAQPPVFTATGDIDCQLRLELTSRLQSRSQSLKSLPKKVSDIQVLSAEIRSYMGSGSTGWWHVIMALIITGCWEHSWSIPGAVVLVGSGLSNIIVVRVELSLMEFGLFLFRRISLLGAL